MYVLDSHSTTREGPNDSGGHNPSPSNRDLRGTTAPLLREVYINVLMFLDLCYCSVLQAGEICFFMFTVSDLHLRSSLLHAYSVVLRSKHFGTYTLW